MWFKKLQITNNHKNSGNLLSWVFNERYWKVRDQKGGFVQSFSDDSDVAFSYVTPKLW